MKLIVTIVQNDDADALIDALTQADFRATRLASTGGFLRQGNTTIILGVEEAQIDPAIALIAANTHADLPPNGKRPANGKPPSLAPDDLLALSLTASATLQTGRATIFVLNLERYEHV